MRRRPDQNYFHFTRKERNGIIVLLCIILCILAIPRLISKLFPAQLIATDKYAGDIARLRKAEADTSKKVFKSFARYDNTKQFKNEKPSAELFVFDPNTLTAEGWKRLGVKDKTIATIQNYLSKGGRFREAADIKNIWGLQYMTEKLLPYVRIAVSNNPVYPAYVKNIYEKKGYLPVDINNSDSNAFISLPGIGSKLSQRIITFREKLGGFYSADQVAETFGLPDSTYQKIRASLHTGEKPVKQININNATLEELKAHPYIRYHLANAIVQYREQHGKYNSILDIRHIMLVNDSIYKKISPYLNVE